MSGNFPWGTVGDLGVDSLLANQSVIERGGPWLWGFFFFKGAIVCL